jgi:hypothetical protein
MQWKRTWVLVAVCAGSAFLSISEAPAAESAQRIPLLPRTPSLTIERDMPLSVQARLQRAQRRAVAVLRAASKQQRSRAAGCTSTDFPGVLGPPAPAVAPRLLGRHVEVVVRFARLPSSLACRPWGISVSIRGRPIDAGGGSLPWTSTFQLRGPVGRGVIRLPIGARAPYRLAVRAETITGLPSRSIEQTLSCPAFGCPDGDRYDGNGGLVQQPARPVRGIDRATLERSFRDALTVGVPEPFKMSEVACSKLTSCRATFLDPLFPRSPYRVRYRIEGEHRAGCWMVRTARTLDPLPYEDTYHGGLPPAGCAAWLR